MMRIVIFLISLIFLSGCYLANGSPPSFTFWQAPEEMEEAQEKKIWGYCDMKSYNMLDESQRMLFDKGDTSWKEIYQNKNEYKKYKEVLHLNQKYLFQCLYDSGLRFRPSWYWCLALDGPGSNMPTCVENMKYSN
ncbi:hypothetical protein P9074_04795 [Gallibacterium anatis]|uniref:Lipoprotein n=1 Tax=Gallibacterium anatis 4895 TaxID=1396510 RepID=A0A0A3A0W7_9PAST|nr:hypothetical protein [Gallibacterium anatis]KGQ62993.1 hypothetical protein IO48_02755 [Gallibacterium anatis 4895]KGQ68438.1 hypothetical protein IO47_04860 [Gallibacterium anatis]WIM81349.1 hypothetical protein QP019_08095 [Gallibacterium anatis]